MKKALEEEAAASGHLKWESTVLQVDNITLGAVRPQITFQAIEEAKSASDLAFRNFRLNVQRWVTRNVPWDQSGTQGQEFRLHPSDTVSELYIHWYWFTHFIYPDQGIWFHQTTFWIFGGHAGPYRLSSLRRILPQEIPTL